MQATATRRIAPNNSIRDWSQAWISRPVERTIDRATLRGLEVRESSFGDWLAAGGDRRTQPRTQR